MSHITDGVNRSDWKAWLEEVDAKEGGGGEREGGSDLKRPAGNSEYVDGLKRGWLV